jgi:bacterioferritin-associated ferredoxin
METGESSWKLCTSTASFSECTGLSAQCHQCLRGAHVVTRRWVYDPNATEEMACRDLVTRTVFAEPVEPGDPRWATRREAVYLKQETPHFGDKLCSRFPGNDSPVDGCVAPSSWPLLS